MNHSLKVTPKAPATLSPTPSAGAASSDFFVLQDMKACLRRHLAAGLIECSALSRDLVALDPDLVMAALNGQFDPHDGSAPIQDCFADGFGPSIIAIKNAGGEPLASEPSLPSGVPL